MPPSATGILMKANLRQINGFTLLEVIIVLVIISIVTTVALLSLHLLSHARAVTLFANQLKQTLQAAQEEALLRPAVIGLRFSNQGFQFYELILKEKKLQWYLLRSDTLSRPHAFESAMRAHLTQLNYKDLNTPEEKDRIHYIVFSANGRISPFSVVITDRQEDRAYLLSAKSDNTLQLTEITS